MFGRFFPIVELTRNDSGAVQDSQNGDSNSGQRSSTNGPQPGGLESLNVGPFGSILSLDNTGDQGNGPDISVLGMGGR